MVTSRKPSKRPSMFEVAKLAGVSHQTVSRVTVSYTHLRAHETR